MQPVEEKIKVEQGVLFVGIRWLPSTIKRRVTEMTADRTKGKEGTATSCCTANSNQT